MNILVTGVGGPTPRSFVRAIKLSDGEFASKCRFIGVDCNRLAYGLYDQTLFEKSYVIPRADEPDYWDEINRVIDLEDIDMAVVQPEVEVIEWSRNRSRLRRPVKTHLPDIGLASALINKHRLHELLEESPWIPAYRKIIPESYSYGDVAGDIGETFWIRSTEGSSGLGSLKIENEGALKQWISINPKVREFIATEYLPGRNMACKMLYFEGELKRTACAERVNYIMAKVAPSGITGNTSFGRLINEPGLVQISEKTLEIIAGELDAKLNGIFTVDFKEDAGGNPKITEINIRHVAFTSSIAAGGANIPLDTLQALDENNGAALDRVDYRYDKSLIFLRDVDALPIVMNEDDLFG